MINELDETIRQILITDGGFDQSQVEVSFDIPDREWSAGISKPTLNCYLFDIRENRDLRQHGVQVEKQRNGGFRQRPPLRFDFTYLVTAWTREIEDEHLLLWRALQTLARFDTLPAEHVQGVLGEGDTPIYARTAISDGVLKSPGEFWTALENQLKPSVSFVATLIVQRDAVPFGALVLTRTLRHARRAPADEAAGRGISPDRRVVFAEGHPTIGGTLRNKQGAPIADARISIVGSAAAGSRTNTEGRFTLAHVPAGTVTLQVAQGDGPPEQLTIQVPSDAYDITLKG